MMKDGSIFFLRSLGFDPKTVHVKSVVFGVALRQVFLRAPRFSPVNIFPQCCTTIFIYMSLSPEGETGENREAVTHKSIWKGRAMAQAVSQLPLTAEGRVRSQGSPCEICSGQSGTGTGFLQVLPNLPVNIILTALHTHLYPHVALNRIKGRRLGSFQKGNTLSQIG
jgi:hypothetical protein